MWYVDMVDELSQNFANFERALKFVKDCKDVGYDVSDWRICYYDENW